MLINLLTLIILVLKTKKSKNISVLEAVDELLPTLINQAETMANATGKEKKEYVLKTISEITNSKYAKQLASTRIETILSTPQKKGKY